MITVQFLITSLILVLLPGTGVIYTISVGLIQKSKAGIYAAIGCTLGIIPHLVASFFGLSAIMRMSSQVFALIKYAGCLYLLYLAIKTWLCAGKTQLASSESQNNAMGIIWKGIALNVLNQKLTLFSFLSCRNSFGPMRRTRMLRCYCWQYLTSNARSAY